MSSQDPETAVKTADRALGPSESTAETPPETLRGGLVVEHLSAGYGSFRALKDISLDMQPRAITAVIGPSGCGKSTLVRCLNRMHEVVPGAWVEGKVLLDGEDIYASDADPVQVRRFIGMVFQKPNPFPMMSVYDNVAAGLKLKGTRNKAVLDRVVETSLKRAALWDEVKDKLDASGAALSGGQQQRLCIARALAIEPDVLLMDEPCSALDPIATTAIEDLMRQLAKEITIVIVTHNMQQAARVSDRTAFLMMDHDRAGQLIEYGETHQMFTQPKDGRTEAYITGRFG